MRNLHGSEALGRVLQAQKVVVLLTGRYAGKKAVIVRNYDEGTSGRKYGHAVVCGLSKEPRKVADLVFRHCQTASLINEVALTSLNIVQVIKRSSQKVQKRRSSIKVRFCSSLCICFESAQKCY